MLLVDADLDRLLGAGAAVALGNLVVVGIELVGGEGAGGDEQAEGATDRALTMLVRMMDLLVAWLLRLGGQMQARDLCPI